MASSGHAPRSSRSMSKSTNSARSTSSSVPTPNRATCRASSEPIDPPAPVTITVFPVRKLRSSSSSSFTASRPSRSSISTSRMALISTDPLRIWYSPGMICALTGMLSQIATIRRMSDRDAWAMVITTWSMSSSGTSRGRSRVVPMTLTPWINDPCLLRSSSTNPRISRFMSPRVMISLAANTPAWPAPTNSTACFRPSPLVPALTLRSFSYLS